MPYCTLADIMGLIPEEELIQLTDDYSLCAVDQTRIDQAIADAQAEIDAYAASQYPVPFSPVPAIIRKITVDLAGYALQARRQSELPEGWKERQKAALKFLENLSRGIVTLGPKESAPRSAGGPQVAAPDRVFSRESLSDY